MRVKKKGGRPSVEFVSRCLFLLAAVCAAGWLAEAVGAPDPAPVKRLEALNPEHNLRAQYGPSGARFFPFRAEQPVWWLDLSPLTAGPEGSAAPWPAAQPRGTGDQAEIDADGITQRFTNGAQGVLHQVGIEAMPGGVNSAPKIDLAWELRVDGDAWLKASEDGRGVDVLDSAGLPLLRYEIDGASDAQDTPLPLTLSTRSAAASGALEMHLIVEADGAAWPIKLAGRLFKPVGQDPAAISQPAAIPQWPPFEPQPAGLPVSTLAPQVPGLSFDATNMGEAGGFVPADATGDISPTQILVGANRRLKIFDRNGVLGGLNHTLDAFFVSVRNNQPVVSPQVRWDRLAQRWFVIAITTTAPNRIVMAVSSGPNVASPSSFTYHFFQHDLVAPAGDTGGYADAPSLGVDRFALYIGTNTFNGPQTIYMGSAGFVVRKASLLAGSVVVTAFRGLNTGGLSSGPYAPRGVDNDDPAATEGYFIGSDNGVFSRLTLRRVSDPGTTTPTISPNINLSVPATTYPTVAPHLGSSRPLDTLDDRLFAARIHRNKITGTLSLWTAHNIEVNNLGVATTGGGRTGVRWYEVGSLTSVPVLLQAGTLFDPAAAPRSFFNPTIAMSGQGNAAVGCSTSGSAFRIDAATIGRVASDPPGTLESLSTLTSSTTAYNADLATPQHWGSYSATVVDPVDDMTLWTIQEYCSNVNQWGVRVAQLIAPTPPIPSSADPATICQGRTSVPVVVGGSSPPGSGFFDPGPDTGGPGYAAHMSAIVTGGVTVSGTQLNSPNQVTLTVSTTAAALGPQHVIITNPDGQTGFGNNLLTVVSPPVVTASSTGPVCAGGAVQLSATSVPGAAYSWSGPGGFTSTDQNPLIDPAPAGASGSYSVTVTLPGCLPVMASTNVSIIGDGLACDDANACTQADTCQAGACVSSNPVVCNPSDQCHLAGTCDPSTGVCSDPLSPDDTPCNDGDLCTRTDVCESGTCAGTRPVICTPTDQCHAAGVCAPATGLCSSPVLPDGEFCDDGDNCTQVDECRSGTCQGFVPVVCTALDQCHLPGVCDPGTGSCSNPNRPNGTTCSDANACTQTDTCQAGTCTGANPVVCAAPDQCHLPGTCNPGTGVCSNPNQPDGSTCSDANGCTQSDTCQSGTCVPGSPVTCAALDQCHDPGTCDPGTGVCTNPNRPNGATCNDANSCTQTDTCQAGACTGANPVACTALDQCHMPGTCNPGTGVCSNPNQPNGTACGDADLCNGNDTCQAGVCTGGAPVTCTALDQCHDAGVCDPGTGLCSNPIKPNGTACGDADLCNGNDTCQAGVCSGGAPVTCTALDQCHDAGVCDPGTGLCSNPIKPNGTACGDANLCNGNDTCQAGLCTGGTPVTCTALDQCHDAGVCDPGTGLCTNPERPDGVTCSDGNGCTRFDACQSGACIGEPVVCTPLSQCHLPGTCDPGTGVCSNILRANGTTCNDSNACTRTDTCQTGVCTGSNPVVCTALDFCHLVGTCNPLTGVCSNPNRPNGATCTDFNGCTRGDNCQNGVCQSGAPRDDDVDGHADTVCGGDDCNDQNNQVWRPPSEVTGLDVTQGDPANPSWDSQAVLAGPSTIYDLVSGAIGATAPGVSLGGASCLQSTSSTTYADSRAVPPGSVAFWYLVRARNGCGTGTYGTAQRNAAIPACP